MRKRGRLNMNARATPPNPARASGRRNPNCVSRVLIGSTRLLKSGGSTIGGLCGEPGRFVPDDRLKVFVHLRCQALKDARKLLPVAEFAASFVARCHARQIGVESGLCPYPERVSEK